MEESIIMINAISPAEIRVSDVAVVPFCYSICVGMTNMLNILNTAIDCIFQFVRSPIAIFIIMTYKVVIFWNTYCCVTIIIMFADKKLKIIAAECLRIIKIDMIIYRI